MVPILPGLPWGTCELQLEVHEIRDFETKQLSLPTNLQWHPPPDPQEKSNTCSLKTKKSKQKPEKK